MKSLVWTVLGLSVLASPALAREACEARPAAARVALPSTSMSRDMITLTSAGPTLSEKGLQYKALLKAQAKCDLEGLDAGGVSYAVFETSEESPVVVVRSAAPDTPIFFVASFMDLTALVMPALDGKQDAIPPATHLLGVATKTGGTVLRLYAGQPDAAMVREDTLAALQGRLPPLASRSGRGKNLSINIQPDAYKDQ